ncbi:MAG TPA: hypothetical protein VFV57_06080 [Limnobacter sp.]|nr:hypothetical protein [Limnobacter sp.]
MKKIIAIALFAASTAAWACYTYTTTTFQGGQMVTCTCTVCGTNQTCNCF